MHLQLDQLAADRHAHDLAAADAARLAAVFARRRAAERAERRARRAAALARRAAERCEAAVTGTVELTVTP